VRAQWAAKPFVWHIYPQDEGAHWVKLSAFLARYTAGLDRLHAAAFTSMWDAWNRDSHSDEGVKPSLGDAWAQFMGRLEVLTQHAQAWSAALATRRDLAAELVDFTDNVL